MPQVNYTVDFVDGAWTVGLNDKRFGPCSTLETAVAAASNAAHKAEAQGYEAVVTINTPDDAKTPAEGRDAAGSGEYRATGALVAGGGLEPPTCGL